MPLLIRKNTHSLAKLNMVNRERMKRTRQLLIYRFRAKVVKPNLNKLVTHLHQIRNSAEIHHLQTQMRKPTTLVTKSLLTIVEDCVSGLFFPLLNCLLIQSLQITKSLSLPMTLNKGSLRSTSFYNYWSSMQWLFRTLGKPPPRPHQQSIYSDSARHVKIRDEKFRIIRNTLSS